MKNIKEVYSFLFEQIANQTSEITQKDVILKSDETENFKKEVLERLWQAYTTKKSDHEQDWKCVISWYTIYYNQNNSISFLEFLYEQYKKYFRGKYHWVELLHNIPEKLKIVLKYNELVRGLLNKKYSNDSDFYTSFFKYQEKVLKLWDVYQEYLGEPLWPFDDRDLIANAAFLEPGDELEELGTENLVSVLKSILGEDEYLEEYKVNWAYDGDRGIYDEDTGMAWEDAYANFDTFFGELKMVLEKL